MYTSGSTGNPKGVIIAHKVNVLTSSPINAMSLSKKTFLFTISFQEPVCCRRVAVCFVGHGHQEDEAGGQDLYRLPAAGPRPRAVRRVRPHAHGLQNRILVSKHVSSERSACVRNRMSFLCTTYVRDFLATFFGNAGEWTLKETLCF